MIDPLTPTTLYAGTDIGVFRSTDNGAIWMVFNNGLPPVPVMEFASQPNGLIQIATYGRGAYELPTIQAANVSIAGRVLTNDGRGLRNAIVSITDSNNIRRNATTSSFGNYTFADVRSGESYTIGVSSKRYVFAARTVNVSGNLTGVDFVGMQ